MQLKLIQGYHLGMKPSTLFLFLLRATTSHPAAFARWTPISRSLCLFHLSQRTRLPSTMTNAQSQSASNPTKTKSKLTKEEEFFTLEQVHNLGHLASSTERFARSNGMTPQQVQEVLRARRRASIDLHHKLLQLDLDAETSANSLDECSENAPAKRDEEARENKKRIGKLKHRLICRHRRTHFRNPFVCKSCWTHGPICICPSFAARDKASLPSGVERVVVWTHHEEWGRTANTGSLLPLGLENTQMLMKGLDEHDALWKEMVENRGGATPVALWPGGGEGDNTALTLRELKQRIRGNAVDSLGGNGEQEREERILLISIEGTWNNARKMVNKLPSHILRLDINDAISSFYTSKHEYADDETTTIPTSSQRRANLPPPTSSSPSLLAPLRRQGKGKFGTETNVSTLEATIIALIGLGLDEEEGRRIVEKAKEKVDRIREFTGKVHSRA